jgi:hypothetical protein
MESHDGKAPMNPRRALPLSGKGKVVGQLGAAATRLRTWKRSS